jgi:hypothetical protein
VDKIDGEKGRKGTKEGRRAGQGSRGEKRKADSLLDD